MAAIHPDREETSMDHGFDDPSTKQPLGHHRSIGRRPVLVAAAAAILGPAGGAFARPHARNEDGPDSAIDLEAFVAGARPLATQWIGDTSRIGQDRYLHAIASWAVRLRDVPIPAMRETTKDSAGKTFIGANEADAPFTILHWKMEPNSQIAPHPHLYGNVVTLCLEGEVRIENYEIVGDRDFDRKDAFPVRRVLDQVLLAGDVNLVSLEHAYIHGFRTGATGARGLDITTRIREKRPTPTLLVGAPQGDPADRRFLGRWQS